jgi:hypothetical protein
VGELVRKEISSLFMAGRRLLWLTAFSVAAAAPFSTVQAEETPVAFQQIETETLDEEEFIFPDDMQGGSLNIVLLAMSADQDNGTWQGDALLEWYAALEQAGVLSDTVLAWHFSVMKVPFFVKGLIRGGMAKDYAGKVPPEQSGAIFVKDLSKFAGSAGIELDGQPTIVLVASDGELLEIFKGEVSEEGVAAVSRAVSDYSDQAGMP